MLSGTARVLQKSFNGGKFPGKDANYVLFHLHHGGSSCDKPRIRTLNPETCCTQDVSVTHAEGMYIRLFFGFERSIRNEMSSKVRLHVVCVAVSMNRFTLSRIFCRHCMYIQTTKR